MLAGLITPPIIFASTLNLDNQTSAYLISASLIGCGTYFNCSDFYAVFDRQLFVGILSLVQMSRMKLFGGYYLGTGLISVVGTSFATLSTANAVRCALHTVACSYCSYIILLDRFLMSCIRMGHVHLRYPTQELSLGDLVPTLMAKS